MFNWFLYKRPADALISKLVASVGRSAVRHSDGCFQHLVRISWNVHFCWRAFACRIKSSMMAVVRRAESPGLHKGALWKIASARLSAMR